MGFRTGSFGTIWKVDPQSDTRTRVQLSVSRKDKQTGQYETDFSGFVDFVGKAAATKAAKLHERDRIKLGDVDVTTHYVKEKNITYTNYKCFSFDGPDELEESTPKSTANAAFMHVDDGEQESILPF